MTDRPPGGLPDRAGMTDRAFAMLQKLSLQNILVLGLLALVAAPSYFAWRFMSDESFRREFRSGTEVVDAGVPCLVATGNAIGPGERTLVAVSYDIRNRLEYLIAVRSPSPLAQEAIATSCTAVHAEVELIKAAQRQAEKHSRPPEQ